MIYFELSCIRRILRFDIRCSDFCLNGTFRSGTTYMWVFCEKHYNLPLLHKSLFYCSNAGALGDYGVFHCKICLFKKISVV